MKMRRLLPLLIIACGPLLAEGPAPGTVPETLTLRLTRRYDEAWDRGDVKTMYEMMDPDCVFQSPFQRRLGRDDIRDHAFRNVGKFRDSHSTEESSHVGADTAYSFATLTFNEYGPDGAIKSRRTAKHLFIFGRRPGEDWKIRFMITLGETTEGANRDRAAQVAPGE